MQKFISKYGLAAHLAILAVAPLFLFPFCSGNAIANAVLWLSLFAAIWVLMEPSRRLDEMLHDARLRVAGAIAKDPVFWLTVFLAAAAATAFANDGIAMAYDAENYVWKMSAPAAEILPGSVAGSGYLPFAAAIALVVLLQGCRHALGKAARIAFLFVLSLAAGISAAIAAILGLCGNGRILALAACDLADASFCGFSYGLCFLAAICALPGMFERRWTKAMVFLPISLGGSALGLFLFAPARVSSSFAMVAVLTLAVSLAYAGAKLSYSAAPKCLIFCGFSLILPAVFVVLLLPEEMWQAKIAEYMVWTFSTAETENVRAVLSGIASGAWSDNPWLGTGLGSFPLDIRFRADAAAWAVLPPLQKTALDGWRQLLAERGIIGAALFVSPLALLAWTWFHRLAKAAIEAFGRSFHSFVRATNPVCWLGVAVVAIAAAGGFCDVSVLRPDATLIAWPLIAVSASSFPIPKKNADEETTEK
ncbi:MAG: hypothetical protein ILO34_08940 [Kiritimatiellae bacterium]|nr:hypothetical protein [Kiritimatiellia bacterium]